MLREEAAESTFRKLDKGDPEKVAEFQRMKDEFVAQHPENMPMVEAAYSSAGDKYLVTLINISGVEGWFQPNEAPRPSKQRSILLVPSAKHCRVSDIDIENSVWLRDVEYQTSEGETQRFQKGRSCGQLLRGWLDGSSPRRIQPSCSRISTLGGIQGPGPTRRLRAGQSSTSPESGAKPWSSPTAWRANGPRR
jgi:hypothetical protein